MHLFETVLALLNSRHRC